MAVYRRTYSAYAGSLTPEWSRWLVIFRYSRRNLFRSKFQTALFVGCFFFPTRINLILTATSSSLSRGRCVQRTRVGQCRGREPR